MLVWKSKLVEAERDKLVAESRARKAEAINRAYASVLSKIGGILQRHGMEPNTGLVEGVAQIAGVDLEDMDSEQK
jgi:hypothetical protein